MTIVSSTFTIDEHTQIDGRRWCLELHTTDTGEEITFHYLISDGEDPTSRVSASAVELAERLLEREVDNSLSSDAAPTLHDLTPLQFMQRLRERFRKAERVEQCVLCWWLYRRITAGHITDAQCRNAFNLTTTQWNNFKTNKLIPRANAWQAILDATSE